MGRNDVASVPCQICGDKSHGRHYGLRACDGCSCFFKRSVRRNMIYHCITGDDDCVINKKTRNWCPACRLKKCDSLKMNRTAVQRERGPRGKSQCSTLNLPTLIDAQQTSGHKLNDQLLQEVLINVDACVLLAFLSPQRKIAIMQQYWPVFFLLHCIASENSLRNAELENLSHIRATDGSRIKLDSEELRLSLCLLLCKIGIQNEHLHFAAQLFPVYRCFLVGHCRSFYPQTPERHSKILEKLDAIFSVDKLKTLNDEFLQNPMIVVQNFYANKV